MLRFFSNFIQFIKIFFWKVWYGSPSTKNSQENQKEVDFEYSVRIRNILGATPEDVLRAALNEFRTQYSLDIRQPHTEFILQIAGQQVYVTRPDVPLTQFVVRFFLDNFTMKILSLCCFHFLFSKTFFYN